MSLVPLKAFLILCEEALTGEVTTSSKLIIPSFRFDFGDKT